MNHTILFLHSSDELYGADRILVYLIDSVLQHGDRPIVIVPQDVKTTLLSDLLRSKGVTVHKINLPVLRRRYFTFKGFVQLTWNFLTSLRKILRIIRAEQVDLIHSNTLAVFSGALASRLVGKPHIWHIHEIITSPRILAKLTSWLAANLSDKNVCVSTPTMENLVQHNPGNAAKTIVIYNGIELGRFNIAKGTGAAIREAWKISPGEILVGMVGRISNWKGQDYFLQAAHKIENSNPLIRFSMVGGCVPGNEDMLNRLRQKRNEFGLDQEMIIDEFRDDIPAVLDAYDIFVLPSTKPDPFPTVILEAMAMSRPVVANRHGGSQEMVLAGVTGFLVTPGSLVDMTSAIEKLANQPDLREEMGKKGRLRLETCFSLEQFQLKWHELYQNMIGQVAK